MARYAWVVCGLLFAGCSAQPVGTPVSIANFESSPPSGSSNITNAYLPMKPGITYVYDGYVGKTPEHDTVQVTRKVKTVDGLPAVVTVDTGYLAGVIEERTIDWFTQDASGNVWYMGEYATQYKKGKPSGHAGSWQAGVNGAQGGIIMKAHPDLGDTYRQENYPGVAEDMATVISLRATVSTPFGNFVKALETKEFSALEPGALEHKYYEPGIGNVKTVAITGKPETLSLTAIEDEP